MIYLTSGFTGFESKFELVGFFSFVIYTYYK